MGAQLLLDAACAHASAQRWLPVAEEIEDYLRHCYLPAWRGGYLAVVTGDASAANLAWLRARHGRAIQIELQSWRTVFAAIERQFREVLAHRALSELAEREPEFSAFTTMTRAQAMAFLVLGCAVLLGLVLVPRLASIAVSAALATLFAANAVFRAFLLWIGEDFAEGAPPVAPVPDEDLPIYSVLVPLYREANVMPALIRAMQALDYPSDRLDLILIVEADDFATLHAANSALGDSRFSIIRVPEGSPRTKPRACNYALPFARGDFTVIYDAEDRPEPDQLRKAVAQFRALPEEVACLQARLNYFNVQDNWLTKAGTLDFSLWFDYLLPGLDRLAIPMPLGGTSNHFRTAALRTIHGWDPYNVTEDADLGIRLARVGLRVRTLDSTTFEEAANTLGNWTRQRSRWLKGYMQTWLVHMRSPRQLLRNAGPGGFIGFQLFVGGTFVSALLNPVLWIVLLASWLSESPHAIVAGDVSFAGLLAGNGLYSYLAMLAPCRRGWLELAPHGLSAPLYWLLISFAGMRALWQLFTQPWRWEKTHHGLSKTVQVL